MKYIVSIALILVSLQSFSQVTFEKGRKKGFYYDTIKVKTNLVSTSASDSVWAFRASDSTFRKIAQSDIHSGSISAVDTIYRTAGKDSIQFTIGGRYHAIKDSVGGGSGSISPALTVFTSGSGNWTTPNDISASTVFEVTLVGGGAGGTGMNTANAKAGGGGGGGGLIKYLSNLTANTAYAYVVGTAGGAGTSAPTNGTDGGNTTLTIGATTYTASGGIHAITGTGGAGGTGTNGDINITGQSGGTAPGGVSAAAAGTMGGDAPFGLGLGGAAQGSSGNGLAGTGYGGGGSGGVGTGAAGGAGTTGIIIIKRLN